MNQTNIVLLEDEPLWRVYASGVLRDNPAWTVESFSRAQEAIEYADRCPIDLLIADIFIPGLDGISAAERILSRRDCAVIFVTGSTDPETLDRARALGPDRILKKPVDEHELLAAAESVLTARSQPVTQYLQPDFLLDTVYDTAEIGMCVTDEHRNFVRVNRAYLQTYGYSREQLIGRPFTVVLPEQDREWGGQVHDDFIAGTVKEIPRVWQVVTNSGEARQIYVTAGRMIGNDGRPYKVTTVADISEQQARAEDLARAVEEKQALLREVHHRVKNNLSTLVSVVGMQLRQHENDHAVREALTVTLNRIKTMARTYERLSSDSMSTSANLPEYLGGLASDLLASAGAERSIRLEASIDGEALDIDTAINAGLVVNELLTNALKHAFPEERGGTVKLDVSVEQDSIRISVQDDGVGLPAGMERPGESNTLGFQLVQAICGGGGGSVEVVQSRPAHIVATLPRRR